MRQGQCRGRSAISRGGPTGQLRLADATRAEQGDQPAVAPHEVHDARHVAVAADELDRGVAAGPNLDGPGGGSVRTAPIGSVSVATVPFQGDELGRRIEAELLAQPGAVAARGPQRVALAAGTVQGEHQHPPRAARATGARR